MHSVACVVLVILCMQSAPVLSAPQETASTTTSSTTTTSTTPASTTTPFTLPPFTLPNITFPTFPSLDNITFPTLPPLANITFPTLPPLANLTFPTLPPFPLLNITFPTFPPFTFSINKRSISSTEASLFNQNCKDTTGKVRVHGSSWLLSEDPCVVFACLDGVISAATEVCTIPACEEPMSFPGECCLKCANAVEP